MPQPTTLLTPGEDNSGWPGRHVTLRLEGLRSLKKAQVGAEQQVVRVRVLRCTQRLMARVDAAPDTTGPVHIQIALSKISWEIAWPSRATFWRFRPRLSLGFWPLAAPVPRAWRPAPR
jgi:hypothetical protein